MDWKLFLIIGLAITNALTFSMYSFMREEVRVARERKDFWYHEATRLAKKAAGLI
jgi:hypothetical protein